MYKNFILFFLLVVLHQSLTAQITYIAILNHNNGNGNDNLFNSYVSVNQNCYIDWEVYADGMVSSDNCGDKSVSRLVLRRMGENDPTSVIASVPIYVPGICGGKNGNNDKYYVNLSAFINKPGRYSVEIQADLSGQPNPFNGPTTRTTYNFSCPTAYYLTGTGGPTGNYYAPSGACAGASGLSDPVGNVAVDQLTQLTPPILRYFTVGEVSTYRQMVVLGSQFYDIGEGKFLPGNPRVPASMNGLDGIPSYGVCPVIGAPALSLGGEINISKRTDCGNADVTGGAMFYRVFKAGTTPPAYSSFSLNFRDDCPSSSFGPENNNFSFGGNCQNANGILDQRWQTTTGVANILPASFALADSGLWKIQFYTETYQKDCAGNSITFRGETDSTSFLVNNAEVITSPCYAFLPVVITRLSATPANGINLLNWQVEQPEPNSIFEIQQSFDGYQFTTLATRALERGRASYQYNDATHGGRTVYYRIVVRERSGHSYYSSIVRVQARSGNPRMTAGIMNGTLQVQLENFSNGTYHLSAYDMAGSLVAQTQTSVSARGTLRLSLPMTHLLSGGIYHVVLRDERGRIAGKTSVNNP
jgi:hypothetical protein